MPRSRHARRRPTTTADARMPAGACADFGDGICWRKPARAGAERAEMTDTITISVDAMGGDKGPRVGDPRRPSGAARAQEHQLHLPWPRRSRSDAAARRIPDLKAVSAVRHCDNVIAMDEKPSQALRKGRGTSSMWTALQSVKDGEADVAISGGNTGALMAMATFCLRPMEGISRPGHRRHLADPAHRHHRARRRRHHRRRRQAAGRFLDSRRRPGPRAVRPGIADRRPAQCRHRRDQGPRRGQGSRHAF